MKDNKLEIGDVLYEHNRYHGIIKHIIERLTPTTAVAGNRKYKIEVTNGGWRSAIQAKIIGEYGGDALETPKLKEDYELQELYRYAVKLKDKINLQKLDKNQLQDFITFVKPLSELVPVT